MSHPRLRRILLVTPAALAVALAAGSAALAHIEPDPGEAPAGSEQRIVFTVEHGCDDSPTIQLDMRLPEGMTGVTTEPPDGWTGDVVDGVVTFSGGSAPAHEESTFTIVGTLPATPDVTVYFPTVQRCEEGEVRWIDIPSDGSGDEGETPAPAIRLTAPIAPTSSGAPTTTEAAPTTTEAAAATTAAATTTTAATATTAAPTTAAPTTSSSSTTTSSVAPTTTIADAGTSDDGTSTGAIVTAVAIGSAAVLVAGLVIWQIRRRS
jgi:uncharacterized protein YcnI